MILPIYTGTKNKMLREKSKPVKKIDKKIKKLIKDMFDTLEHANGLGLAAPQIGSHHRILLACFQLDKSNKKKFRTTALINPEILHYSKEKCWYEEGCLSLPDVYASVERPESILVKFLDEKGGERMLELTDLNARVVQHEVDHLDGKLFSDYLSQDVLEKHKKKLEEMGETIM
jgi:peptide deformylase